MFVGLAALCLIVADSSSADGTSVCRARVSPSRASCRLALALGGQAPRIGSCRRPRGRTNKAVASAASSYLKDCAHSVRRCCEQDRPDAHGYYSVCPSRAALHAHEHRGRPGRSTHGRAGLLRRPWILVKNERVAVGWRWRDVGGREPQAGLLRVISPNCCSCTRGGRGCGRDGRVRSAMRLSGATRSSEPTVT